MPPTTVTAQEQWRLGHRPGLDGLRGVAVLIVLGAHALLPTVERAGRVGVALFFALSGFLITSLLLEELADRGRVDLRGFYRRRALRLLPALALMLAFVIAISLVRGQTSQLPLGIGAVASYLGNWVLASGVQLPYLGHTWSLAIEEQFYIAWPLALLAFVRFRRLGLVLVLLAAASSALRLALGTGPLTMTTPAAVDAILLGCAAAIFIHQHPFIVPRPVIYLSVGAFAVTVFASASIPPGLKHGLAGWSGVVLVLAAATRRSSLLEFAALRYVGRISYGLYLWDAVLVQTLPGLPAVSLVATFVVAGMSFRFVETPFLRRRHQRDRREPVGASAVPSPVVVRADRPLR